jgi:hypothetical protein
VPDIWGDQSVIPAVEAVTGAAWHELPVGWETYLAQRLHAETDLVQQGFVTEAILLYRDPEREQPALVLDVPTETLAKVGSIHVADASQSGVITWAEVHFLLADNPEAGERVAYEPYRVVDGRWVHTWPQLIDWGVERQDFSAHVTVSYFDLDAPSVEGLLPYLEQLYVRTAGDLGLDTADLPPVLVSITPSVGRASTPAMTQPRVLAQEPERLGITVPSPYSAVRYAETSAADYVRMIAARDVITALLMARVEPFPVNHPFAAAFLTWELERFGLDSSAALQSFLIESGRVSQPWPVDGTGKMDFRPPYQDQDYYAARALLDVLVRRYGPEIVPVLVENLGQSSDVDDWLMHSAGITFADVEDEWSEAVSATGE